MGTLSNFGELKTAISDYSGRTQPTYLANRWLFVMRAHSTLMRDLRIPLLQASTTLSISAEKVTPPSDFRSVESLVIDSDWDNPLSPTSIELRARAAASVSTGRPLVFAKEADKLAFGPAPDTTYAATLIYNRALDFFVSDQDTNVLLNRYPFAYLYGALAEAARFDKFDEDAVMFEAMFRSELSSITQAEISDAMSGGVPMPMASGGVV